jgi:hypothetical protein
MGTSIIDVRQPANTAVVLPVLGGPRPYPNTRRFSATNFGSDARASVHGLRRLKPIIGS